MGKLDWLVEKQAESSSDTTPDCINIRGGTPVGLTLVHDVSERCRRLREATITFDSTTPDLSWDMTSENFEMTRATAELPRVFHDLRTLVAAA